MAYGLAAAEPIAAAALARGTRAIWSGLPKLVVVLAGGFTTNAVWCLLLNARNGTAREYIGVVKDGSAGDNHAPARRSVPLAVNYVLCAAAGVTWYFQFFFYTMGETQMGAYKFSSWTLHMASIIVFSTLWGVALREWKGTTFATRLLVAAGLATLVAATVVIGYGNYAATH
jgi:L-rhamnose-H+ transport protein